MSALMYTCHIINNAFLIIFILMPLNFLNYDGGDILNIYGYSTVALLIASLLLCALNKENLKTWIISAILSLVSLVVVMPLVFFYLFFGIPPK
ncbi:hypothetical protein CD148_08995 [Staphylococcus delphini]|uniref:Uncharacterized protein n=1 Tax=Staphylococcus delphini TaxID=53344 RepID=A0AAX0QQS5_9STAP|nr:hypothetical protein B5C07_12000 [Staphylococcus delphini]PNZ92547.1 hypothetical protein CD148_08995 [Staphylococcus delphini]RIZ56334.1 hypothetical protein CDL68_02030 [Staphylococcus delphini]